MNSYETWNKKSIKIAISGKSGCGNTTVSKLLADKLGLRQINYTFRDIAKEEGMEFQDFYKMAQKDSKWDLYLDKKQVEMADEGACVLGSRLAVWLFENANFKVYLFASPEVRAGRILEREGGTLEEIMAVTDKRDAMDQKRYEDLYKIHMDDFDHVDLVVDAASNNPQQIVNMILEGMEKVAHRFTKV